MTGLDVSRRDIINQMKNRFNLSFKKVSQRVIVEDQIKIEILKIIFCFELANILKSHLVIVNIDEVLLTNSIKPITHEESRDILPLCRIFYLNTLY